jgi:fructoselysine-6-phosphate deglycase
MLNFDRARFVSIQSAAVAQADRISAVVADAMAGGITSVVFLGTGGAGILMLPAARLLQVRSRVDVDLLLPAEVLLEPDPRIGPSTLVVLPSLSGTTQESVHVELACLQAGARVLALTANGDSPVAEHATDTLVVPAEDDTSSESFYLQSLLVALAVLRERGELGALTHERFLAELTLLPELLADVKAAYETSASVLAKQLAEQPWHIFTGAGSTWAEAFYYAMCILEEMQWIRTRPVHAADFFHGTLELVEPGVSLVLLKGEDLASRALVERVEAFVTRYTDTVAVLDAADAELPGVSDDVRALISPVVLAAMLERVSAHLEVLRDHPLTTRRYYRRVTY